MSNGFGGVTVRAVAAEAGISTGSLRHVFPSKEEMLTFASQLALDQTKARVERLGNDGDPLEYSLNITKALLPTTPSQRIEFVMYIGLFTEVPGYPGLTRLRRQAQSDLLNGCSEIIRLLIGKTNAEDTWINEHAALLASLIDGFTLKLYAVGPKATKEVMGILRHYLEQIKAVSTPQ